MNKRTILALLLISAIFILWDDYLGWVGLGPKETPFSEDSLSSLTTGKADQSFREPASPNYSARKPELGIQTSEIPDQVGMLQTTTQDTGLVEQFIVVETENFRARLTTYGAGITSFLIKPVQIYIKDDVELIPPGSRPRPYYRFWTYDGPIDTDQLRFTFDESMYFSGGTVKVASGSERKVSFVTSLGEGRKLAVIYTFTGDGYAFTYEVKTSGLDGAWVRPDAEVYWKGGLAYTEPDSAQDVYYSVANIYYSGDVLEKLKLNSKKSESEDMTSGQTRWGSIRTKYFMAALIPKDGMGTGGWMESQFDSTYIGKYHPNQLGVGIKIPLDGGDPSLPITVYLGPLDDEILDLVEPSLKKAMTWGAGIKFLDAIVSPISKVILWTLKGIHKFVPNYGVCVIILSVIIKIVIWPLTRKSYQSMAAMQRLQPRMKALRDKYGKDQQRLQREIMQLYKTEKVNPMGGCLPMLLQMPLLYALFVIFRSTIEFRRAPFMLWISDLSLPDALIQLPFTLPLYGSHIAILPLVMGVTTFFQSKSTMTDPNQKMILYMMPIFLTLIFNQFPSGLTLYYTLFNVWTLLQQKYTASRPAPTTAADAMPRKG